jgi:hypothetical protein
VLTNVKLVLKIHLIVLNAILLELKDLNQNVLVLLDNLTIMVYANHVTIDVKLVQLVLKTVQNVLMIPEDLIQLVIV